jgi:hypothetical protein
MRPTFFLVCQKRVDGKSSYRHKEEALILSEWLQVGTAGAIRQKAKNRKEKDKILH